MEINNFKYIYLGEVSKRLDTFVEYFYYEVDRKLLSRIQCNFGYNRKEIKIIIPKKFNFKKSRQVF